MAKQTDIDKAWIKEIVESINESLDTFEQLDDDEDAGMAKLIAMKTRSAAANMYSGMMNKQRAAEYEKLCEVVERVEREMIRTGNTLDKQSGTHQAFVSGQQSIIAAIAASAGDQGERIMEVLGDAMGHMGEGLKKDINVEGGRSEVKTGDVTVDQKQEK